MTIEGRIEHFNEENFKKDFKLALENFAESGDTVFYGDYETHEEYQNAVRTVLVSCQHKTVG